MIILLDIDGVVADFTGRLLEVYNHFSNENVTIDQIKSNKTGKWVKDYGLIKRTIESTGFIRSLSPIPGAIDGIKLLKQKDHDIVFVSNATNCSTSGHEKREWLKYHFKGVWDKAPLILTSQKWRVRGDVLIDDDPKNLVDLIPPTKGLIFHQQYNSDVSGYERINDWGHLIDWVNKNEPVR